MKPQLILPDYGKHNEDIAVSAGRILRGNSYKDVSTICVIPTRGKLYPRVVQSWFSLITPMNQKFYRMFMTGMEVGDAYTRAVEFILDNPELSQWKYMLTLEEDNIPPPDGIIRLLESIVDYDVVGGIYWTKGEGGMPMIYGNPRDMPRSFIPQVPIPDSVQPCNGLGMGFTLFRLDIFKDSRIEKPFFKTLQEHIPYVGTRMYTQDLSFFEKIIGLGYRVACDTRVKVGHYDPERDIVW